MVSVQQTNPVLLVADVAPRLEGELAIQGMSCVVAMDQNDAVQRLQATKVPFVVVPSMFGNGYSGVTFAQGVLQYFESQVVLYGNGVDAGALDALLRTGRVAHFSQETDGRVIADFLARRARGSAPPTKATPLPSFSPHASPPPSFNPRPGTPPPQAGFLTASPKTQFTAPPLPPSQGFIPTVPGVPVATTSYPPQPATFVPTPSAGMPIATTSFPPQPSTFISTPSGGFPAAPGFGTVPRPPTIGATPGVGDAQLKQALEQMAADLARSQSEMAALKATLSQSEQERAALLVEVEAARRSAMAEVAQVMALSDEGDPISQELEELRNETVTLQKSVSDLRGEADMLRAERDRLVAEAAAQSGELAEARTRADATDALARDMQAELDEHKRQLDEVRKELEREKADAVSAFSDIEQVRVELEAARTERDMAKSDAEALIAQREDLEQKLALEKSARAEVEQNLMKLRVEVQETQARLEEQLRQARVEGEENVAHQRAIAETEAQTRRDIEAALRIEIEKLRSDVAAARTDATTVRLDLQEAVMRLDETAQTVTAITLERDALRAEAGPLRDWASQVVSEHAHQQAELERLRKQLALGQQQVSAAETLKRQLDEVQAQLAQALRERDQARAGGGGNGEDVEVVLARSRELANLVRALEPFMWGLTQATHFYHKAKIDGADEHLRLLQQLQGVLLRLRDEIAMLDLS